MDKNKAQPTDEMARDEAKSQAEEVADAQVRFLRLIAGRAAQIIRESQENRVQPGIPKARQLS